MLIRLEMQGIILLLALMLATTAVAETASHLQALRNTHYHPVESETLGRALHVYVMTPDEAAVDGDQQYPVIYVLDGGALYPLLVAYYRYLVLAGEIPEAIVVGLSYGSDRYEDGNLRGTDFTAPSAERDYYGGAGRFQAFLESELLPLVESQYPARADRRILFGQSLGGQFVLYSAQTRPDLFWGRIASNPALHRNLDFFLQTVPDQRTNSRLFVASGTRDDPRFREPAIAWMDRWSKVADKPWALETTDLDGHSHMSAPPAAFRRGLIWLFDSGEGEAHPAN